MSPARISRGLRFVVVACFYCLSCWAHPVVGFAAASETPAEAEQDAATALLAAALSTPVGSPEIQLLLSGTTDLPSGSLCDFRFAGTCDPDPVTFTILNLGSGTLLLTSVSVDNTSDFTLTQPATNVLPAFSSLNFQLDNPTSGCCTVGTLTLECNDADEASYIINLLGDNS